MRKHAIATILLVLFTLSSVWGFEKTGPVDFTLEPILSSDWVCYIQDRNLFIRRMGSPPLKLQGGKDTANLVMSPSVSVVKDSVFVAWIEKGSGTNRVFFTSSRDNGKTTGKPLELSSNTKATQVRLLVDGKERLYLIEASSGKEPEITLHLSLDRGETFKKIPIKIEGFEALYNPTSVAINDMLYMFFYGVREGKKQIGVKTFEVSTQKPMEYHMLKETAEVSFIEPFVLKNRAAVIYKTAREGKFVLEGAVRGDAEWEVFSIPAAEGLDVARMDLSTWKDGRALVVFSGEEKGKFKQRIYAAVSEDRGRNWDVTRIDHREFDNTTAWLPRMAVDGERVAVVWEDSRDIRSAVRMRLSPDRGKSWIERDVRISDEKHYALRPRISFAGGAFYAVWDQFRTDEKVVADMVMTKLSWAEAVKMASKKEKGMDPKKKEASLRARANAYWKGMVKKDMKVTYEIHDPFYRAKVPFNVYASQRGSIVYHSYHVGEIKIEGNVATVKLTINYEVPKIILMGKETSMPPKEVATEDTYLFIDGKWYRKFVDAMSGGSAIDY
jgi:hypothetical protein